MITFKSILKNILKEENTLYEEDIKKIVTIINQILNTEKFVVNDRFDYTNNKQVIKRQVEKLLSPYSYTDNVKVELNTCISSFLNQLESEPQMPKRFAHKDVEYFDAQVSGNWKQTKDDIVKIIGKNVQLDKIPQNNKMLSDVIIP